MRPEWYLTKLKGDNYMNGIWNESNYNDAAVKDICHNCGSKTGKQSYNFFRRMNYVTGGNVWCKIWHYGNIPVAFYYANLCKNHIRLIEIAVKSEYQGKGIGRKLLFRLLRQMKEHKIGTLTFRTPINEEAQFFWLKMGAKIIDVKGADYEMQIKIIK